MENPQIVVMEASSELYGSSIKEMSQSATWESLLVAGLAYILQAAAKLQRTFINNMNNILNALNGTSSNGQGAHHVTITQPNGTQITYNLKNNPDEANALMSTQQSASAAAEKEGEVQGQGLETIVKDTNKADTTGAEGLRQDSQAMAAVSSVVGFTANIIGSVAG